MGSSPEEFAELRRLLAAKRAEQPPPGYFNTFASKIVARIEAEELAAPKPWWVRWFASAPWSPGLATANTAIVTGLALLGGTAWYFKARPDRKVGVETAGRPASLQPGSSQTAPPLASVPLPQLAGFDSLPFARGGTRMGFVQTPPVVPFQLRQPSVRERPDSSETEAIPPGIFEPWNAGRGLPTSIVHHVETRR